MIVTWGMSDKLGPITYEHQDGFDQAYFPFPVGKEYSNKIAEEIDAEIKRIMGEAYTMAKDLIQNSRDKVEAIANSLLKYETLDAQDVKVILNGGQLDKPTVADLLAAEQAKAAEAESAGSEEKKDDSAQ